MSNVSFSQRSYFMNQTRCFLSEFDKALLREARNLSKCRREHQHHLQSTEICLKFCNFLRSRPAKKKWGPHFFRGPSNGSRNCNRSIQTRVVAQHLHDLRLLRPAAQGVLIEDLVRVEDALHALGARVRAVDPRSRLT